MFLLMVWILSLFGGPRVYYDDDVNSEAVQQAYYVLNSMLSKRPEYKVILALDGVKLVIYNEENSTLSHILEEFCPDETASSGSLGKYCPLQKIIITWQGDLLREWGCGQYTIHEIAHALEHQVMMERNPDLEDELAAAYNSALTEGVWPGYYAMDSRGEFWATGVMAYFDVGWDKRARVEIKKSEIPPALRDLSDDFFSYLGWSATCLN